MLGLVQNASLRGVFYRYRADEFPEKHFSDRRDLGFLAQEVEAVLPELVYDDADGFKHVAYARFAPVLAAALGALSTKHEDLLDQHADLAASHAALSEKHADLERRLRDVEAATGRGGRSPL